jgi:antirestriction protein
MALSADCRIYVASLADYNTGVLHGTWLEVTDESTMRDEIETMLAESPTAKAEGCPAEEWAIHDFEGFGEVRLSEYEDLDWIVTLAEGAEEHGEAFLAWVAHEPRHNREVSDFQEAFLGQWPSLAEYVEDFWEQCGDAPKAPSGSWWHPANYVNWERMANDLELSGDVLVLEASSGVFVFSNR